MRIALGIIGLVLAASCACNVSSAEERPTNDFLRDFPIAPESKKPSTTSPANPSVANDKFLMRGIGVKSCGSFLAASKGLNYGQSSAIQNHPQDGRNYYSESAVFAEWAQGFITAMNLLGPEIDARRPQIATDYPGVDLWIRRWCQDRPDEMFIAAVNAFVHHRWDDSSSPK